MAVSLGPSVLVREFWGAWAGAVRSDHAFARVRTKPFAFCWFMVSTAPQRAGKRGAEPPPMGTCNLRGCKRRRQADHLDARLATAGLEYTAHLHPELTRNFGTFWRANSLLYLVVEKQEV